VPLVSKITAASSGGNVTSGSSLKAAVGTAGICDQCRTVAGVRPRASQ
jgi:hypothetical protein